MKVQGSNFELSEDDQNLTDVKKRYGATHDIEAVFGTKPDLRKLMSTQSVCWGDGKTYHFRLTVK